MTINSPEKKRKRASEKHGRPSKKAAIAPVAPPLKVQFVHNPDGPAPIIASTPGVNIPEDLSFNSYTKQRPKRSKTALENASLASSELLLQTSSHPRLDFTGNEGETELDSLWNHYVAVYDREAGTLQLTEARKMTVRACVRLLHADSDQESDGEIATQTAWAQRTALTEAFGTKQSRKAVQSLQENALLSSAPGGAPSAAESALLSSIPQSQTTSSLQKSAQEEIQAAKPLPQPNLSANHPSQVYPIESLVPGGMSTLNQMPIEEWEEPLAADENVQTSSRFVCNRIRAAARSGDEIQLQILRFMIMLLEFSRSLKHSKSGPDSAAPPGSKRLPSRDDLRAALSSTTGPHGLAGSDPSSVSDSVIDAIRRKFAPLGQYVTKTDLTLLHTTICALAFHVPPDGPVSPNELTTDTANLRDDLRLDNPVILQYFRELGCRVDKPRETEFAKWGIKTKAEGAAQRIARLRLPLEFPKVSRGGGSRRR